MAPTAPRCWHDAAPKALGVGFPGSLGELGGIRGTQKHIEGPLASPCQVCGVHDLAAEMQLVDLVQRASPWGAAGAEVPTWERSPWRPARATTEAPGQAGGSLGSWVRAPLQAKETHFSSKAASLFPKLLVS